MNKNRRDFLKTAGLTVLGAGGGIAYLNGSSAMGSEPSHGEEQAQGHGSDGPTTPQLGLVIDLDKLKDDEVRQSCIDACHREHNVPDVDNPEEDVEWIRTSPFSHAFPDQVHRHTAAATRHMPVPILCNHCTDPACVQVCPTQATWKRDSDGIVMMDMHRCIGCRYCMAACPYGARSFNWQDPRDNLPEGPQTPFPTRTIGVVEKCNFCAERLRMDPPQEPACVVAAREATGDATGDDPAIVFGDVNDPESEIAQLLNDSHTICRKLGAGTGPNVFYLV